MFFRKKKITALFSIYKLSTTIPKQPEQAAVTIGRQFLSGFVTTHSRNGCSIWIRESIPTMRRMDILFSLFTTIQPTCRVPSLLSCYFCHTARVAMLENNSTTFARNGGSLTHTRTNTRLFWGGTYTNFTYKHLTTHS